VYESAGGIDTPHGRYPIVWADIRAVRFTTNLPLPEAGSVIIVPAAIWHDVTTAPEATWEAGGRTIRVQYPGETWRIVHAHPTEGAGEITGLRGER
jgi:hypothetical protein